METHDCNNHNLEKKAFAILTKRRWGIVWYDELAEYMVDSDDLDFDVANNSADQDPVNCILKAEELQAKLEKQAKAG